MSVVAACFLGCVLLFTLLFSVQIAAGFGELCGIRPGRDKSGLGGFAMLFVLFAIRWCGLAVGMLCTANGGELAWLLPAHVVLGIVSVRLFDRGVERVHRDGVVSFFAGLAGSTLIPAPAWVFVVWRSAGGSVAAVLAAIVVIALHVAIFAQRRAGMLSVRR